MNYSTLLIRIKEVFPDNRAPARTLYDGQRDDDYGLFSSKYEAVGRTLRWHETRLIDLQETPFGMSFLSPQNQHYYLPAYLLHLLIAWEKGEHPDWRLEPGKRLIMNNITGKEVTACFTREQVEFVIDFLKVLMLAEPGHNEAALSAILQWERVRDQLDTKN